MKYTLRWREIQRGQTQLGSTEREMKFTTETSRCRRLHDPVSFDREDACRILMQVA